jgi:16S rRNA (cytidine1402-2'-O)-methyltransferase
MACGLNGQRFTFHGYLPVESPARGRALRALENESLRTGTTQVFIETPYRNGAVLRAVFEHCHGDTLLCIATDLSLTGESIAMRSVGEWKKKPPALDRRPTVFALWRGSDETASGKTRILSEPPLR